MSASPASYLLAAFPPTFALRLMVTVAVLLAPEMLPAAPEATEDPGTSGSSKQEELTSGADRLECR